MSFRSLVYPTVLNALSVTYVMLSFDKSLTQFFHHGRSDTAVLQPQLIWNLWKNSQKIRKFCIIELLAAEGETRNLI